MKIDLVGRAFIDLEGPELTQVEREVLMHPQVGGVVLFARNYEDYPLLQALIHSIRSLRSNIILAIDHEGGRVQRFKEGFTHIPSMQRLGDHYQRCGRPSLDIIRSIAWVMAAELRCAGVDISFAPVLDVDRDASDVIGDRSFSDNVSDVTLLADAFITGMSDAKMPATGKHFPGHGSIKADSHVSVAIDSRDMDALEQKDLLPFTALAAKLGLIMPAHVIFEAIDPNPVGYSCFWLNEILRQRLRFQGVIISDDLSMVGATHIGEMPERALAAIDAGCDVVLMCNDFDNTVRTLEVMEKKSIEVSKPLEILVNACQKPRYPSLPELQTHQRWRKTQSFLDKL